MTSRLDDLHALLEHRHSVRGFRSDAVPPEMLRAIFAAAQRAPSWCNIQPWRVALTMPPVTALLAAELGTAARAGMPQPELPFPIDYPSPYQEHRRKCGGVLYEAMGITRDNKAGRYDAWMRNFALFDAPHLAVVSCDRRLGPYAYLDVGVWLGYLLAAAEAAGVSTIPMAAVATYPAPLRARLPIADGDIILFAIALGFEDSTIAANQCRTTRDPIESNVTIVASAT